MTSRACLERMGGKTWLQTFQGLCVVHEGRLPLRALLLPFLCRALYTKSLRTKWRLKTK